ncbi:hypothetical protein KI688_011327 [Linnemannia hyalina]|uniref:Gamma-glutamylcyclotransferase AIG2-like domain-containing protein n=1 Tax=Linnemannia hyalina TaxID=64524 RepID=A0A9P7XUS4_9FUNG|nr:hypothetical protein KI688_011327 [Linnemannia hyalina]
MSTRVLNSVTRPGPESNLHAVPATIQGYIRYPYHNEPYPGMIATKDDPTSVVEGLLVFGHSLMDRFRLDQFEGSAHTYILISHVLGTMRPSGEITSISG